MDIRPIRTEEDYKAALREVSAYFDDQPARGTADGDRFEVLLTLVEAHEAKHYVIDLPDPVEAIRFRAQIEASLADARPCIPDNEARTVFAKRKAKLKELAK